MNAYVAVATCVMSGLCAMHTDQPHKNASKEDIQVQVTGMLSSGNTTWAAESPYSGAVFAGGRHFFLDCKHNKKGGDLLRKEYADLVKHTGFIPSRHVHVTGHLRFVPYEQYDEKGKKIEQQDTLAVIEVESVMVVK